jgi:hypothetical protein
MNASWRSVGLKADLLAGAAYFALGHRRAFHRAHSTHRRLIGFRRQLYGGNLALGLFILVGRDFFFLPFQFATVGAFL